MTAVVKNFYFVVPETVKNILYSLSYQKAYQFLLTFLKASDAITNTFQKSGNNHNNR